MSDDFVWSQDLLTLFYPGDLLALLYPADLRSFFTCSKSTSWRYMRPFLSRVVKRIMTVHYEQQRSAMRCAQPRSNWTEDFPICSSPLCSAFTGLWLPSIDELNRIFGRGNTGQYMCGSHVWGSRTMRSILEERAWEGHGARIRGACAFVACCPDCGKLLKEIARIRGQHEHVLLASHVRELPHVRILEARFGPDWADFGPASEHLLLSEMEAQSIVAGLRERIEAGLRRNVRRRGG